MSYSVDVNVLLYASNRDDPLHNRASQFLETCSSRDEMFCLTGGTLFSYLRISTHPAIFPNALTPQTALANIQRLIDLPQVRVLVETEETWEVYGEVTRGLVVRGNLVTDAHLVTLLVQHGVETVFTNDSDFRKFDRFVRIRNPFAE